MPKYKPTSEDIYPVKPCAVCGADVLFDEDDVCSSRCAAMLGDWGYEWQLMLYREERRSRKCV